MKKEFLTVTCEDVKSCFPKLPDRANKGSLGRVLMVCGSYDPRGVSMCGAAYFSTSAAYRSGAGIVEIFTPRENYPALASLVPEAVFSLYGYDEEVNEVSCRLIESLKKSDAVVIGCGLGKSAFAKGLLKTVFLSINVPLLIDADGLNILSEDDSLWALLSEEQRKRTVVTPHPGEMSRLCQTSVVKILEDIPSFASDFAKQKGIVCLLKDHNTAISDGNSTYINQTGNAGMATAGMGDILAGIIGAIIARKGVEGDFLADVATGAHVHGLAGDIAADKVGEYSLISSDLLPEISGAIEKYFE